MPSQLRTFAKRLLRVRREPTYYLPWITHPQAQCVLLLNNIESRFKGETPRAPIEVHATQYASTGALFREYRRTLSGPTDTQELELSANGGKPYGLVTVTGKGLLSGIYVALSDGASYSITHGRYEFIDYFPPLARALIRTAAFGAGLVGKHVEAFGKDQFVYAHPEFSSHLLLLNLSNVTNTLSLSLVRDAHTLSSRRIRTGGLGAELLDLGDLLPGPPRAPEIFRLQIRATSRFNYYLIGAGPAGLAGPLSIQHVK